MTEEWRDIKGYEGIYQVSNLGNIKALKRKRKNGLVYKEHLMKSYDARGGYKRIMLCDDSMNKNRFMVHRLVAMAFIENPNNLPQINHKDENPKNNNVENLEWCTCKYNQNYGGRIERVSGENNSQHKLTEQQVREIRKTYIPHSKDFNQEKLASKYGVTRRVVHDIIYRHKWKRCLEGE